MKNPIETLDDVKRVRAELQHKLAAAYEAAVKRGGAVVVADADRERFEEACVVRASVAPVRTDVPRHTWIRC